MEVFVVASLALAVLAAGTVVVAVLVLRQQLRLLTEALRRTGEQVRTLSEQLGDETAVLALESDALRQRLDRDPRRGGARYTAPDRRIPAGS